MIFRTWPYGTKLDVEVLMVTEHLILVENKAAEKPEDAIFLILGHGLETQPKEGSAGSITFTEGGPTGGYWKFTAT